MDKHPPISKRERQSVNYLATGVLLSAISIQAFGEVIDPEVYIQKNGYQSEDIGDDGKTVFYTFTERAKSSRIKSLETGIEELPKHIEVKKVCDFMRGGAKAKLIAEMGIELDVAVTNYGYQGSTIACVLKYMHGSSVGTQLMYSKKGASGMYLVFVTD